MADTVIVGRIAIRVLPDTSDFRPELRAKLAKETAGVNAEVPVDAILRAEGLKEKVRAKAEEVSREVVLKLKATVNSLRKRIVELTKEAEAQSKADPISFSTEVDDISAVATGAKIAEEFIRGVNRRRIFSASIDGLVDTSKLAREFSKDLVLRPKFDLEALRRQAGSGIEVSVRPDLWVWTRAIRELKAITAGVTGGGIDIPVMPDFDRFVWWMKVWSNYFNHRPMEIPVHPDLDDARLDRSLRQLGRRKILELEPAIKPSAWRKLVNGVRWELKKLWGDIRAGVTVEVNEASVAKANAELIMLYNRWKVFQARVKLVLDRKSVRATGTALAALSGGRLFKKLVSLEPLKNLDTQLPKIAVMATLLGQAGNYLTSMASDALSLGRSIAYILPTAFALPGIFAAAAVSAYALIASLKEFNERIPEMGKGLSAMQASMTEAFWERAHDGLASMTKLIPGLTKGFVALSSAAGGFMGALGTAVTAELGPRLAGFFSATAKAFDSMTGAARPIGRILGNFIDLGTVYMPRLGAATAKVTKQFDDWFRKSLGSGEMFVWIERGISSIKALGGVTAGVWRIFDGLSQAAEAAGGTNLQQFAAALDRIQKTIKTADFQRRLVNVFSSARIAIERMVEISGPAVSGLFRSIGDNANKLLPIIGTVAGKLVSAVASILDQPVVGDGLVYFFNSLSKALDHLQPVLREVGKGIGGLLRVLGTMATSFAPIIEIAIGALEKHADGLLRSVESLIRDLSRGLSSFMTALLPSIEKLAPAINRIAESIGATLGGALSVLGPLIAPILGGIANLVTAFSYLPGVIQAAVVAFLLLNSQMGARFAQAIAPILVGVKNVGKAFTSMGGPIGTAATRIQTFASTTVGRLGKVAVKAALVAVALGAIGQAFSNAGSSAGFNQMQLALEKMKATADSTDLSKIFGGTRTDIFGKQVSRMIDSFKVLEDQAGNLKGTWSNILDVFPRAANMGPISEFGQATEKVKELDQALASMAQSDPEGAARAFQAIMDKAAAAGMNVDSLKGKFKEYQAGVQLAAGNASGAFTASADEIKRKAQEIQSEVVGAFQRMDDRVNGLRGKARIEAIKEMTTGRQAMLAELDKTTAGLDKKMVEQASKLNTKIATTVTRLAETNDSGTREKLQSKLDTLMSEYRERFGNLPNLIGSDGGSISTALDKLVGSGISPGAQASIGASITAPVTTAVAQAKAKLAELPAAVATINISASISQSFAAAGFAISIGASILRGQLTAAMQGVVGAVATAAARSAVPVATAAQAAFRGAASGLDTFVSGFRAKTTRITAYAKAASAKLKSAMVMNFTSQGAAATQSFANGLRSKIPAVIAAAKAVTQAAKDNKGPEAYDKIMLFENGVWVIQGFIKGVLSQVNHVKKTMRTVTGIVAGTDFSASVNLAASARGDIGTLANLSTGVTQNVYQIGDVTVDVKELDGIKTVDELAKTLRRKKRQAGG